MPSSPTSSRLFSKACYLILVLLALEASARLAWKLDRNVPFFHPQRLIDGFYKDLGPVRNQTLSPDDGYFDILLLGGSVMSKFYPVARILDEQLNYQATQPTRMHNLAYPAHTSRDSLYKYQELKDKHFDLVILYHGINETRSNNCPPQVFKQDYSHHAWYRFVQQTRRHAELPYTILPYTLHFLWITLQETLGSAELVSFRRVRPEWRHYGADIKTAASYRDNLVAILELAEEKAEPVLLLTFAYYIAPGYTLEKFAAKQLDYTLHKPDTPIEVWGAPANVAKGIDTHNRISRTLARRYGHVTLVDQDELMPHNGRYYLDICHLTVAGATRWVEHVVRAVLSIRRRHHDSENMAPP